MADKITNLKTQTGDNVYPNIIGENRKDSFADSLTIKHYYYAKTHKVGFQLANDINIKIQNSLQKPVGLTKTELVGAGTNGQENIEIGDNLKLENGKLSATGGGEGSLIVNISEYLSEADFSDFVTNVFNMKNISKIYDLTSNIETTDINNIELDVNYSGVTIKFNFRRVVTNYGSFFVCEFTWSDDRKNQTIMYLNGGLAGDNISQFKLMIFTYYYSHFITLTNDNDRIYLLYQDATEDSFDMDSLNTALSGKKVICTGVLGNSDETLATPLYVSGEAGEIEVYYVLKNDAGGNISSESLTNWAISDLVSEIK